VRPEDHRASVPLLDEVGATDFIAERLVGADEASLLFMDIVRETQGRRPRPDLFSVGDETVSVVKRGPRREDNLSAPQPEASVR